MKQAMQAQLLDYALMLEWHTKRLGCAPHPGGQAISFRSCPSCFGVQIDREDVREAAKLSFPASALGHTQNCELSAMIETLRPCRHEWLYSIQTDDHVCVKCQEHRASLLTDQHP